MPWDDSDSDFFDGFSTGLIFSNGPFWVILLILIVTGLILYYS